ncbi:hypothetical protein Fot_11262 [Forsythia ovata]|uniref:Uncharacterized protein n=1 Tax=Forsythia ovata TaxID=205694 RepID=A0ABD1WJ62_9LAMI
MEDEDVVEDSKKAKRSRETPPKKVGETIISSRGATRTFIPSPYSWTEHINIGSHLDELDPAILQKLPIPSTMVAASVYKYWTSAWVKVMNNADLLETLKLAEMNTSWSHVLNCELYKVLAMKIDELRSTVVDAEDIDELRSKNKILHSRLVVYEDSRVQVEYKTTMAETIERLSVKARKQVELELKVCEDMAHAKNKELTEALAELSKAKELLLLGCNRVMVQRVDDHNTLGERA